MILYHGSNIEIHEIDFSKSKLGKDFGCGFYLSPTLEQAQAMAEKKALLLGGEPIITSFEFDIEAALADKGISFKSFECYSTEWGLFIQKNRENKTRKQVHPYDIVYGPIANDTVGYQIRRLQANIINLEKFTEELKLMGGETYQYFFGTEKSLKFLKKL